MRQLKVVVLERDSRAVLRTLGEMGAVQLRRTRPGPETAPLGAPDRAAESARCEQLGARVEELRRLLEIGVEAEELPVQKDMTLEQAEANLQSLEERANPVLRQRRYLLERQGQLTTVCDQMASYRGMEIPLDGPDQFAFLHFVTGSLPVENLEQLQREAGENVALLPMPERNGRQRLIALTTRRGQPGLEGALQRADFHREPLPTIAGATVDTHAEASGSEQATVAAELQESNEQIRRLDVEVGPALAAIARVATNERRLLEAEQNFPRTEKAVLLAGWVPAEDTLALEQRLRDVTAGQCVLQTTAPENLAQEQVPVLLRHPRVLRPFAMLVSAYGLPNYHELEPTLFVAISYAFMFGMMFGDAGHGAVLALGGLIALRASHVEKTRDVGLLLLFAGLCSMLSGAVYGSFFGLAQFRKYALWHDPLEGDPMALMSSAIGLGIVMISLGLFLNILNHFRRGDILGGFLDKFGVVGLLFYWGGLVLVSQYAALRSRGLLNLALVLFLVLPLVGWALKEPIEYARNRRAGHPVETGGGLGAALTESLVGAFEAVLSYFANTISFVRLAAYAMSHAALLAAAFMIAAEVKHLSAAGNVLSVLLIVIGNLVALILEGIIASVQALRLEYYEFFGKFFAGTGEPFKPFRLNTYGRAST